MNITVIGRGSGGGLADRWERAGHTVTRLGGAIRRAGSGPYFHRFAKPGELAALVLKVERPQTKGE
jgi:hypothetical protein